MCQVFPEMKRTDGRMDVHGPILLSLYAHFCKERMKASVIREDQGTKWAVEPWRRRRRRKHR